MIGMKIEIVPPEGSNAFAGLLSGKNVIEASAIEGVAIYPKGTASGKTSLALFITLPDGSVVHAETTAALLDMIQSAIKGAESR